MQEIMPGIRQFKIPIPNNPLGHTNVYLVGEGRCALIDAGSATAEAEEAMKKELAEAKVEPGQIDEIVVTHGHGDHIGLAGTMRDLSGGKIALHELEDDSEL